MNKLVFLSQKTRKLFRPKKLRGYVWARIFRKVFLKKKIPKGSVQRGNCSRELPHNKPNSKFTLKHCVIVIINFNFFELQTVRKKIIFLFLCRLPWFLQRFNILSFNCQGLSIHLR